MAEKTPATDTDEEIPPTSSSIPAEDPPTTTDNGVASEKPTDSKNDSIDTTVEVELHDDEQPKRKKRRKNCPEYLVDAIKQTNSFTFDTLFCATPDSTPKFGSFDSGTIISGSIRCDRVAGKSEVRDAGSESESEVEEGEKSEGSGGEVTFGSVDGVVESGVD